MTRYSWGQRGVAKGALMVVVVLSACASPQGRPMVSFDGLKLAHDVGQLRGVLDTRCVPGPKIPPVRVIGQDGKEVYASVPQQPAEIDAKTCTLMRAWYSKLRAVLNAYLLPPSHLDLEEIMKLAGAAAF